LDSQILSIILAKNKAAKAGFNNVATFLLQIM